MVTTSLNRLNPIDYENKGRLMEWIDIWKHEPPRNQEILFLTGDKEVHFGEIYSEEKLRKCSFRSYVTKEYYYCDKTTDFEDRVIYWYPIPKPPKE